MAGPSLSIGFDESILNRIGNAELAAKAADAEIKKMETNFARLQKKGIALDAQQEAIHRERLAKFDAISKRNHEIFEGEKKAREEQKEMQHDIHKTLRAAEGVRRIMGAQALSKFARGENIGVGDVVQLGIGFEKEGIKLAKRFFGEGAALDTAKKLGKSLPIVGFLIESLNAVDEAFKKGKEQREEVNDLARLYGQGKLPEQIFKSMQEKNVWYKFFNDPAMEAKMSLSMGETLAKVPEHKKQKILEKTIAQLHGDVYNESQRTKKELGMMLIPGVGPGLAGMDWIYNRWFKSDDEKKKEAAQSAMKFAGSSSGEAQTFISKLHQKIMEKQKQLGRALTNEERTFETQGMIDELTSKMSIGDKEKFKKKLDDAAKAEDPAAHPKSARELYAEEMDHMRAKAFADKHKSYSPDMAHRSAEEVPTEATHAHKPSDMGKIMYSYKIHAETLQYSMDQARQRHNQESQPVLD